MPNLFGNYDLDQLRTHAAETLCVVFKQVLTEGAVSIIIELRRIVIGGLLGSVFDASLTPIFSLRRFSVNPADRFGIVFLPNGCRRFDA